MLFAVTPSDKDIIFDVTSEGSLQLLKKLDREKVNAYYITVKVMIFKIFLITMFRFYIMK
jgi:hypothetical protein